jgi:hypothetical protein
MTVANLASQPLPYNSQRPEAFIPPPNSDQSNESSQPPPRIGKNLQLTQKIICMVVDVVADPENFDWLHPDVDERGRIGTVLKLGKMFNPRIG